MPAQVASPSTPPSLADSLSHMDLKCSANLLVREKMLKDYNGALKLVPFYGPLFLPTSLPLQFLLSLKRKNSSYTPAIAGHDLYG